MRYRSLGLLCLALAATLGCETGAGSPTVPVSGKITMGGNPVAGAEVVFLNRGKDTKPAKGTTDEQGNYKLTTYLNSKHTSGALPGKYDVTVTKREAAPAPSGPGGVDDLMTSPANGEVMKKTRDEETKKIIASGKTGPDAAREMSANVYGKEEPENVLPEKYSKLDTTDLEAEVKEDGDNEFDFKLEK